MKARLFIQPLAALMLLSGCSGAQFINVITPTSGYDLKKDVPFGDHQLKLDVYSSAHAHNAPVLVFFYGGSWQSEKSLDKSAYKFVGQALVDQGYVAIIADYRLYPAVKYPDFLDDCAQAVSWAHQHAAEYGADPAKLILMGHSAGAYNAAMLALDPAFLKKAGADRAWIRGFVGLAGPYDFLPIIDPVLQTVFGAREQWPTTQPIHYVDAHAPPMLLMAGEDDDIVYVKNTNNLAREIADHHGQVTKLIYPSMSHVKIVAQMSTWIPGHQKLMSEINQFVSSVTN
jgi:acetyl esterase/lipase